jgi:hypothetical protein
VPLGNRSVEGVGPLGYHGLRRKDVEMRPPIAPLEPNYIRLIRSLGASTCFHYHSVLGFRRRAAPREINGAAELRSATATTLHANQIPSVV